MSREDAPPPPPAAKPVYLYSWQLDNGSYFFSDNPSNIPAIVKTGKAGKSRTVSRKKGAIGSRSVAKRVFTPKAVASSKARPITYEECMEKILINTESPNNADDMLAIFVRAENACALYGPTR